MAFFVCCYQILKTGRRSYYLLAAVNLIIILMTGSRLPMFMAAMVGVALWLFASQQSLSWSVRLKVAIAGAVLLTGALYVWWPSLEARLYGTVGGGTSGRTFIWEYYIREISQNPWFGRGVGSGVSLLDTIDDYRINYTNAAHNEYLRILMDGGIIGLVMFVVAMVWWVVSECRFMQRDERVLFLGFMISFAIATYADNTLSSPPTLVIFFVLALIIQRVRQRAIGTAQVQTAAPLRPPPRHFHRSIQPAQGE
jgi:O-antigen ligase